MKHRYNESRSAREFARQLAEYTHGQQGKTRKGITNNPEERGLVVSHDRDKPADTKYHGCPLAILGCPQLQGLSKIVMLTKLKVCSEPNFRECAYYESAL